MLRSLVERTDLDALTESLLESFAERPESHLRVPRDNVRVFVRWNIDLVVRWFVDGQPPTGPELETFRELGRITAASGTPTDAVLANFRLAARAAWRALLESATEADRVDLLDGAELLFEFVDQVSLVVSDAYDAAQSGPLRAEERAAQALLARLERDENLEAADHQLAERIGFELGVAFRTFAVRSPVRSADQHTALARRMRAQGALAAASGRRVTGLAHRRVRWHDLDPGPDAVFAEGEPALRGELGPALNELCAAIDVAVTRGEAGAVSLDDYLPEVLLHLSPRIARRLHARVYGPLQRENPELARAMDSVIEHNFDRGRAAASLPVHRNTLANRLERIRALTGVDLDCPDARGLAWLAWLERRRQFAEESEQAAARKTQNGL